MNQEYWLVLGIDSNGAIFKHTTPDYLEQSNAIKKAKDLIQGGLAGVFVMRGFYYTASDFPKTCQVCGE